MSEKSKSAGVKCVSENSTGGKSGVTRNSDNPFESSRRDMSQYFVDIVKDQLSNLVDKRSLLIRAC